MAGSSSVLVNRAAASSSATSTKSSSSTIVRFKLTNRKDRNKVIIDNFEVALDSGSTSVKDLKVAISEIAGKEEKGKKSFLKNLKDVNRQRLSLPDDDGSNPLANEALLSEFVKQGQVNEVCVRDLGPQIDWRTVFVIEYAGPIVIHTAAIVYRSLVMNLGLSPLSWLAYSLIVFHFVKREVETIYVHRFSLETMPFHNIFKNCFHYFFFSGVLLVYPLYFSESADATKFSSSLWNDYKVLACVFLFFYAELSNLYTHLHLSNLRPPGTKVRKIPTGYGFNLVSCANYWFEVLAWVAFSLLTGSVFAWLFTIVSFVQMTLWAQKKHANYLKQFPNYPKNRKAIVPYIY